MPTFSIIITAFNREREISRAIRSCLIQDCADFEVIVVDDSSTDNCYSVAEAIRDPRLALLRHPSNRGGNAARNTGALAAQGEWLIFLDSDDELALDALKTIGAIAAQADGTVHRLAFMYRRDDGRISPLPALRDQIVDYAGYLAWLEGRRISDFLSCTRRVTFECIRYPENGCSYTALYQMDFARRYRTWFREEIAAWVHLDAVNRTSYLSRSPTRSRSLAAQLGMEVDVLLERHGDALRQFAPRTFESYCRLRASYHFLAGDRSAGIRQGIACLRATPLLPEVWSLLIVGAAHAGALAMVRSWRRPVRDFIWRLSSGRFRFSP